MIEEKVSIRPVLTNIGSLENKSAEEKFQNETLRPILKLQHDLLLAFFSDYLSRKKINLAAMNSAKRQETVSTIFKNDNSFRTEIRGLIIGHFTEAEFQTYLPMTADANKRILTMAKERLLSVLLS
jgi:hypothetical protein